MDTPKVHEDPVKLDQAIEHICYEIQRLQECFELSEAQAPHCTEDVIELTLYHARAVLDFLEKSRSDEPKPHRTDILSEDYKFPAKKLPIPKLPNSDLETRVRINREVAHLSYCRCGRTVEQKMWYFGAFVPIILKHSLHCLQHIHKNEMGLDSKPDSKTKIEDRIKALRKYDGPAALIESETGIIGWTGSSQMSVSPRPPT